RLDYMAQKAVEMGASRLQPILTRHAQVARVNLERMRANAIEAAEQCGILTLPEIRPPLTLERMIAEFEPARLLVFCDEEAQVKDPVAALSQARNARRGQAMPLAVLVGPEGGFAAEERAALLQLPNAVRLALRPRPLRADTPAGAALALVGAGLRGLGQGRPEKQPESGVKRAIGLASNSPRKHAKAPPPPLNRLRPRHDERQIDPDEHRPRGAHRVVRARGLCARGAGDSAAGGAVP